MPKRASPGTGRTPETAGAGHNSGLPSQEKIRVALAVDMIFDAQKKALNEKHKAARKKIEGDRIPLDALGRLKKLDGMSAAEIEAQFKIDFHMVTAVHSDMGEQYDIFAPKVDAPERRAAYYQQGLMVGLKGEKLVIPPAINGDALQQMQKGYDDGLTAYKAAQESILTESLDPANVGKTTDGTSGAVSARAAKDFSDDQKAEGKPDPFTVAGVTYTTMRQANAARTRLEKEAAQASAAPSGDDSQPGAPPEAEATASSTVVPLRPKPVIPRPDFAEWENDPDEWTGPQRAEFRRWFESKDADYVPAITHDGAVAYWARLVKERAEEAPVPPVAADPDAGFPATQEELAPSPAPQSAETPDPAAVEAEAKRLQESGFVPPKPARAPRSGRDTRGSKG